MTDNLSNPLQSLGTNKSAIYRPKYRTRTENPSYALEGQAIARPQTPSLLDSLQALEEWRRAEESRQKGQGVRWRNEKMNQLQLYIAPSSNPTWTQLILKAGRDWEGASQGQIHFVHCVRPDQADILIDWSDKPVHGRDFEVGHTHRIVQAGDWITQAKITLLKTPEIDKHLSPQQILERFYTTALHELGHALGLEHSNHSKDIMHHRGWKNRFISPNDIRQLKDLYTQNTQLLYWLS